MPARKTRPVLYELLKRPSAPGRPVESHASAPPPEPRPPRVVAPDEDVAAAIAPPSALRVEDGRVAFTLRWPTAVVLGASLLVLFVVAFQAGRSSMGRTAGSSGDGPAFDSAEPDEAAKAATRDAGGARAAPGESIVTPPKKTSSPVTPRETAAGHEPSATARESSAQATPLLAAKEPAGAPDSFEPEKGAHYLVIQHFPKSGLAAALAARDFLRQNEVACVVSDQGRDWVLIASSPVQLNHKDAAARRSEEKRADALRQRVRALGKQYSPRGYSFDQCSFKVLR